MAKKEIQREPIVEIFDDFDGKPLPGDTKAERYQFNGITYDLYLSDENKDKVDKFIGDLLDGAEKVKSGTGKGSVTAEIKAKRQKDLDKWNAKHPEGQRKRWSQSIVLLPR
ncbi:MAG TPA: histone-like nucleoid-structuring protein Lsr2 [Aeromicrobium sp.]|nr:histone-like nucleoid-structuring protein Lsr2 [Aeromicrobium sp.]